MAKKITNDGEIIDDTCEDCVVGFVPPFFKTPWNHNTNDESNRCGTPTIGESLTDQSFAEDADINNIIDKMLKGAEPPPIPLPEHFGSAFEIPSLLEARERIAETNAIFYNLDATTRSEYLNDPARWEAAVMEAVAAGDGNKLQEWGFELEKRPEEAPPGGTPAQAPPTGAPAAPDAPKAPSGGS